VSLAGWALRGERCHGVKSAERTTRYNIIAALNQNLLFAPFIFEGYSNSETYQTYLIKVLIPALRPGMVLVIDNASFHKTRRIVKLIEEAECSIIFLPPYSPDLNPIEHRWSPLKTAIRAAVGSHGNFWEAAVVTLETACSS
jgi:transposase